MSSITELKPLVLNSLAESAKVVLSDKCGQEIEGDFPLDPAVIANFPEGTQVHSCYSHGKSKWAVIAKVTTTLANGEPRVYFLKCAEGEQGKALSKGEFHATKEIYSISPNLVPQPYTWGQMSANPNTYYFLGEFVEMDIRVPELPKFSKQIVEFHRTSQREFHRMTGFKTPMFGFHNNSCQGCLCLSTTWNDSWADFFCQLVRGAMAFNIVRNGHWKNLEELVDRLCTHVVPLVLGPLEAEGRSVKPTLIHGDLWEGNVGIRHSDGSLVLFDAGSYWAHNEIELATMNSQWSPILNDPVYRKSYREQMGTSEPVEQFDDRISLYSCYMRLQASASHHGASHREECYEHLNYLIDKYAPFPEENSN